MINQKNKNHNFRKSPSHLQYEDVDYDNNAFRYITDEEIPETDAVDDLDIIDLEKEKLDTDNTSASMPSSKSKGHGSSHRPYPRKRPLKREVRKEPADLLQARAFESYKRNIYTKQAVFTICFFLLCVIDQVCATAPDHVVFMGQAFTYTVISLIILTGFFHPRKQNLFQLTPALIFAAVYLITLYYRIPKEFGEEALDFAQWLPLKGSLITKPEFHEWLIRSVNTGLIWYLILRVLSIRIYHHVETRSLPTPKKAWIFSVLWLAMMIGMILSANTALWPLRFLILFGCFYLTGYTNDELEALFNGMTTGIIAAFFSMQAFATMFRTFDTLGYTGMYSTDISCALFYVMAHAAILAKWYKFHCIHASLILKALACFGSGIMITFCFLCLQPYAIYLMIFNTFLTVLLILLREKKKQFLLFFGRMAAVILIAILLFPAVYFTVRRIPSEFYSPLQLYRDDHAVKIYEWAAFYDDRYVEKEELLAEAKGRYFKYPEDSKNAEKRSQHLLRIGICKEFLHNLNFAGHPADSGYWITDFYFANEVKNVFIHIFYFFGTATGLLFWADCGCILFCFGFYILKNQRKKERKTFRFGNELADWRIGCSFLFFLAILGFGLFDITWNPGQLTLPLFFVVHYLLFNRPEDSEPAPLSFRAE